MSLFNPYNKPIDILTSLIKTTDFKEKYQKGVKNFTKTIIMKDPIAGVDTFTDGFQLAMQLPNALFWEKLYRFLNGSFMSYSDQVRFAAKFSEDNERYKDFVKKLLNLINLIEDERTIDYFANLTRCFFLSEMDQALFFRLAKCLEQCTSEELDYLKNTAESKQLRNNAMVSILIIQGLVMQESDGKKHILSVDQLGIN